MSRYIQVLNALKQHITQLPLTSGQVACRIYILERLEYAGVLNLYGPRGSGKTVLGWCLAQEKHANYITEPSLIPTIEQLPATILFIDNATHQREAYRHILDDLARARVRRAVVVSRERIEDFVQAVPITCTPADVEIAVRNLTQLGFPPASPPNEIPFLDLWDVLQFSVRR